MSRSLYPHRFTDFTDALVPVYNWGFKVLGGRGHEVFRQRVIELAGLAGHEHVLDAGCGTGMVALRIAAQFPGCVVKGVDISPKMVAAACRDAQEQGLLVDFHVASILDLPYPESTFDVVTTNIMYHHLNLGEKQQAVFQIARVLKSGGRYISAEFGPRAKNSLQRRLAKGEYTLYPSHLISAELEIVHEELGVLAWQKKVVYRVAIK